MLCFVLMNRTFWNLGTFYVFGSHKSGSNTVTNDTNSLEYNFRYLISIQPVKFLGVCDSHCVFLFTVVREFDSPFVHLCHT